MGTDLGAVRLTTGFLLLLGLGGCGTYVPDLRDWPNNNNVNSNASSLYKVGKLESQKAATLWMLSNALWWPRPTPEGSRHAGDI